MCQLATFPPLLHLSSIAVKLGERSPGTAAPHATFESPNNCIGSSEALVNHEMPCVPGALSKGLPVARAATLETIPRWTLTQCLPICQHCISVVTRIRLHAVSRMAYRNDCKGSIPLQAANCTEVSCLLCPNFSVWYPVQSCCYLPLHPQALRVSVDLKGRTRTASRLARSGLTEELAFLSALFPAQARLRKKSMGRLEEPLLFPRWDKYCQGHVIRGKAPEVST